MAETLRTTVHRVCAWCGDEFARETWPGGAESEITTWGICARCFERQECDGASAKPAAAEETGGRGRSPKPR